MVTAARRHLDVIVLVVIVVVLSGANLFWTSHVVTANQNAQRRQGELIEAKICKDVGTMAAISPPAGNPAANPSRAFEQAEARAWQGLVSDLGCPHG